MIEKFTIKKTKELDQLERLKRSKSSTISVIKMDDIERSKKSDKTSINLYGNSLWLFGPENRFRILIAEIVFSKPFDHFVLSIILSSCILLTFESPLYDDPKSTRTQILYFINEVITIAFIIEAVVKIIAMGFWINGPESYMRSIWNALDFLVVVNALLRYLEWVDPQILKVIRLRRILKPLSMIN